MPRLLIKLELPTIPSGRKESAEEAIDLGLLAPSLSPAEIGAVVLGWAPAATENLMARLRAKETERDRSSRRSSDERLPDRDLSPAKGSRI